MLPSLSKFPFNGVSELTLPIGATALADAIQLVKGEDLEWFIEDKNTFRPSSQEPSQSTQIQALIPYVDAHGL
jgi:hypothetical protein